MVNKVKGQNHYGATHNKPSIDSSFTVIPLTPISTVFYIPRTLMKLVLLSFSFLHWYFNN